MQDLAGRPTGDPRKLRIAVRLRRETTMTLAWIVQRLHLCASGHVSCLLYRKHGGPYATRMQEFFDTVFYPKGPTRP